jgi:NADH dehydrogenase/NADH:ubiquinone oxidoreductase 75 kD subunit (chain G)
VVSASHRSALTDKANVLLASAAWSEEGGDFLSTEGRLQTRVAALDAPEGVRSTKAVADALAAALGVSGELDWMSLLKQQPSPVELEN